MGEETPSRGAEGLSEDSGLGGLLGMKPGCHPSHGYRRWRPARQAGELAGLRAGPSEQLPSPGWKRRPGAARGAGLGPVVTATGLSPLLHTLTGAWKGSCLQPPQDC